MTNQHGAVFHISVKYIELFGLDRGVCIYRVLSVATDHLISNGRFISV